MKLSIIVPTFHRNSALSKCLDQLAEEVQNFPAELFELIVTDDGYKETAEELIKLNYPWVKWVKGPQRGPAANRNSASKQATGDWLLFTDDDCLPQRNWLWSYYCAIKEQPSVRVFEGRSSADTKRRAFSECAPINERGGFLPSCNFAIKRSLFDKLQGFDEDYPFSFEDMDFHYRVKKAGHEIVFLKQALVLHPWRDTTGKASVQFFKNQKHGILTFIGKHPELIISFNSKHFVAIFLKKLFRDFPPGLITYNGRGLGHALRELTFNLRMAVLLLPDTLKGYNPNTDQTISSPSLEKTKS